MLDKITSPTKGALNYKIDSLIRKISIIIIPLYIISCAAITYFDSYSYKKTISAKVEALELMNDATDEYSEHISDVTDVMKEMKKIYEYEKNREKNEETIKMWELLLNSDKNLFGGFVKKWKDKGKLSQVFIDECKGQVNQAFDMIINLESKKIKKKKVNEFINKN